MTEYRRFQHPGATWFFTVNLAERRGKQLLTQRIDLLRAAFATEITLRLTLSANELAFISTGLHFIFVGSL
jgi:hypothetical protein